MNAKSVNRIIWGNATQLFLENDINEYVRKISKNIECIDINSENNIKVYDIFIEKYSNKLFSNRLGNLKEAIIQNRNKFIELKINEQINVILELVRYSQDGVYSINLSQLGLSSTYAINRTSKEISKMKECKLINQSVTGLYENEIDLLTV